MAETHNFLKSLLLSGLLIAMPGVVCSATFTLLNQCTHAVWPGILSNADSPQLSSTGFVLNSGDSVSIYVPSSWSGRLWGRTFCAQDPTTGIFDCTTGDCGTGKVECGGKSAVPPATLVEFTLNGFSGLDFYDVSLVDGFNLPVLVVPQNGVGGGNCTYTGCNADLNASCPPELKVVSSSSGDCVACRSACEALGDPRYCCSGEYRTPETCGPSAYSEFFKNACPRAYSYAYDDRSSTFTCASSDYVITFCPPPSTAGKKKSSEGQVTVPTRVPIVSAAAAPLQFTSILIIFVSAVWHLVILSRPNMCGPSDIWSSPEAHTTHNPRKNGVCPNLWG